MNHLQHQMEQKKSVAKPETLLQISSRGKSNKKRSITRIMHPINAINKKLSKRKLFNELNYSEILYGN